MNRLKTILIDDETNPREVLKRRLAKYEIDIIGEAYSIESAFLMINELNPDLIFLDVNLPDGNGFELLDKFEKIPFETILATAYEDFALKAIKASVCGYLIKPFDDTEIEEAIKHALERIKLKNIQHDYYELLDKINPTIDNKLVINLTDGKKIISVSDIIRCEGWDKYTYIHISGQEKILSSSYIGKFRTQLIPHGFFECHRSHIINMNHVIAFNHEGFIELSDKSHVPLARRRKQVFLDLIKL